MKNHCIVLYHPQRHKRASRRCLIRPQSSRSQPNVQQPGASQPSRPRLLHNTAGRQHARTHAHTFLFPRPEYGVESRQGFRPSEQPGRRTASPVVLPCAGLRPLAHGVQMPWWVTQQQVPTPGCQRTDQQPRPTLLERHGYTAAAITSEHELQGDVEQQGDNVSRPKRGRFRNRRTNRRWT
jgi:hypothetical protein